MPTFLTLDEVMAIHADRIERHGGGKGIRDPNLLRSALARPAATVAGEWLHPTLPGMAAAYLFHLCRDRPFVDGNERAALAVAGVFMELNGLELVAAADVLYDVVVAVAEGRTSKAELAFFLSRHVRSVREPAEPEASLLHARMVARAAARASARGPDWGILRRMSDPNDRASIFARLREAFSRYDVDGDGYITVEEYRALVASLGQEISLEQAQQMVSAIDLDGNGRIDFAEFSRIGGGDDDDGDGDSDDA
jgi:death-on-curing protein